MSCFINIGKIFSFFAQVEALLRWSQWAYTYRCTHNLALYVKMDCICKLMHINNTCISFCSRHLINWIYLLLSGGKFIIITAISSFIWLLIPCTCNWFQSLSFLCRLLHLLFLKVNLTWKHTLPLTILHRFQVPERQNSYLHHFSCTLWFPDQKRLSVCWLWKKQDLWVLHLIVTIKNPLFFK